MFLKLQAKYFGPYYLTAMMELQIYIQLFSHNIKTEDKILAEAMFNI